MSHIPTGRKIKGKGRGGKIPQGAHKGKVQFQGKKIKFEEEGGEDDMKTGMSFCALDAASLVHRATFGEVPMFLTSVSDLALCCSFPVLCHYQESNFMGRLLDFFQSCPKSILK